MTSCPNQKLTGINEENYIYCNCSDCGFERVKGPCYLEEYFADKDNAFLNEERTRQRRTEGYKRQTERYKNNMKYRKEEACCPYNFLSICHISIV